MAADIEPCPACGALPCDWVQDPRAYHDFLIGVLADIRVRFGVNEKPMLSELSSALVEVVNARIVQAAKAMQDACAEDWADGDYWDAEDITSAIESLVPADIAVPLLLPNKSGASA